MIIGKLYIHKNKINGKCYVGQSFQDSIEKRWANGRGYKKNTPFYRAIQKYGWDNFEHIILDEVYTSIDELNQAEEDLIIKMNSLIPNGYNLVTKGTNHIVSENTKQKTSNSCKGMFKGIPMIIRCPTYQNANKGKEARNKGKIVISKNGVEKYIDIQNLSTYLNEGWQKGFTAEHSLKLDATSSRTRFQKGHKISGKNVDHNKNRIWIYNEFLQKNLMILKEKLPEYILKGWIKGRKFF